MPPSSEKPATQRDVARLAGVSHMTVSRVIQGIHSVAPATAERVREAIEKLRYNPDPLLSALAVYRSHPGGKGHGSAIAFLDCDNSIHSRDILDAARREAEWLGYHIESFRLSPAPDDQRQLSQMLYHRGIRGLFFGPADTPWKFEGWDWPRFTAISLSALAHQPAMNAISIDYFQGAFAAAAALRGWGCRRIAFVVPSDRDDRTSHRWLGGYCAGIDLDAQPPLLGGALWGVAKLKSWLREHEVDGMLTLYSGLENSRHEAWRTARSLKIRSILLSDYLHVPGVPVMAFDRQAIGTEAVRMMHHLLLSQEFGIPAKPRHVAIQGALRLEN